MFEFLFTPAQRARRERDRRELLELTYRYGALVEAMLAERAGNEALSARNRKHWHRLQRLWHRKGRDYWIIQVATPEGDAVQPMPVPPGQPPEFASLTDANRISRMGRRRVSGPYRL